jgi:hypothetical protein
MARALTLLEFINYKGSHQAYSTPSLGCVPGVFLIFHCVVGSLWAKSTTPVSCEALTGEEGRRTEPPGCTCEAPKEKKKTPAERQAEQDLIFLRRLEAQCPSSRNNKSVADPES